MLCIDQRTAEKRQEPFVTLAKTRRSEGKVWFGVHLALSGKQSKTWVKVGDEIVAS
jgi:molybdenum cofactor sulfurtransferase